MVHSLRALLVAVQGIRDIYGGGAQIINLRILAFVLATRATGIIGLSMLGFLKYGQVNVTGLQVLY